MPSSIAHALVAGALTSFAFRRNPPRGLFVATAICAVIPDLDAIGRPFGSGDVEWLGGHRAFTHSLTFAAVAAAVAVAMCFRRQEGRRVKLWAWLALAIATHGLLDAFTMYGQGVMFFAPFSNHRFKSPWLPLHGLPTEIFFLWLPALAILAYAFGRPRRTVSEEAPTAPRPWP